MTQDLFQQALGVWEWEPSILIGLVIWQAGYLWLALRRLPAAGSQRAPLARRIAFSLGTLTAFFALVSPLDFISDHYLFSAHMLQHLLLIMVAPPLWLAGLPENFLECLPLPGWLGAAVRWVTRPVTAYLIFNTVLLVWHIPSFYQDTLKNNTLHIIEHLMFMASAVIGWWPVLGRSTRVAPQVSRPLQVLYVFLMMFPSTLLGLILTFARSPLIPYYASAPRLWELAANPGQTVTGLGTSASGWGLSVMDDQQAAGLLMWVPGNMVYMLILFTTLYAWFHEMEKQGGENTPDHLPGR